MDINLECNTNSNNISPENRDPAATVLTTVDSKNFLHKISIQYTRKPVKSDSQKKPRLHSQLEPKTSWKVG